MVTVRMQSGCLGAGWGPKGCGQRGIDETILNDWGEGMAGSPHMLHIFIHLFFLLFFILIIYPIPRVALVFTQLSVWHVSVNIDQQTFLLLLCVCNIFNGYNISS